MKKLLIIILALATTSYGMQPTIDIPGWITKQLGNITETISKNEAVTQTVKIMQQLAELQALYNQGVQTYNNVGNYSNRFKQRLGAEYWKNKLKNNLDWKNIGRLNQQLGIERNPNSQLYAMNEDLFGTGSSNPGFFTYLDRQANGTMDVLDEITLQGELRNIAVEAQKSNRHALVKSAESGQRNFKAAQELALLEKEIQDGATTGADVSTLQLKAEMLRAQINQENNTILLTNSVNQANNNDAVLDEVQKTNRMVKVQNVANELEAP